MARFSRFRYAPVKPLGKDGRCVTASAKHLAISKEAAIEGTVLLKNDGILPLQQGEKVCLFGRGAGEFIFGGGGSGNVLSDVRISLSDALEAAAKRGEIQLFRPLIDEAKSAVAEIMKQGAGMERVERRYWNTYRDLDPLPISEKTYKEAVEFGGVAILSILRYSTEGTVDGDRKPGEGGFELFPSEIELCEKLGRDFKSVIVIFTVCGMLATKPFLDNPRVGAMLYPVFGGSFAGEALVEILMGKSYPSGHLQDTLAEHIEDYPSTATYLESEGFVRYEEDIFVGYRYFETFCPEKVVFPYGFGLSYTTFEIKCLSAALEKNTVKVEALVRNTGSFRGKEVVQLYLSAPQGKLGKAAKVLCGFAKTRELAPSDEQKLTITCDLRSFASFDDLGKIEKSAFVLEKGEYKVLLGNNVRDCEKVLSFEKQEDEIVRRLHSYLAPITLEKRLTANGEYEALPKAEIPKTPRRGAPLKAKKPEKDFSLEYALENDCVEEFIASLSDREMTDMLYGHPAVNATQTGYIGAMLPLRTKEGWRDEHQIPPVPTSDGPAGCRTHDASGVFTTYFPSGNTMAQTWNLRIVEKIGKTAALEVKENNSGIWLAPGMNIHRSPLCGRNFEYYSEDPFATGMIAAAMVKGVQSQKIAATVKHFCCNNKEINRKMSDSRVSERALREIYLRGFEIAVKKASPWCIMTSYNMVNGRRCSASWELIRGILKGEWKYPGLVMTDWWTYAHFEEELAAGSDVKMPVKFTETMPGAPTDFDIVQRMEEGHISRNAVYDAVRRILHMMGHFE
ncbi:MAG: beta-glucosidase [Ruminococcaceae bacterium]|nr:beta-glucosidase [Oscillospiraceae bacterium]